MKSYPIPGKAMDDAMRAHTNLTVYGAIVAILEGGTLSGNVGGTPARIIAMCQKEQQRQLTLMDKAVAASQEAASAKSGEKGADHG